MADPISLSARYVIKTGQLGAANALASTPLNDSLVIEPEDSSSVTQLWYFSATDLDDYYRMHTEDKRDNVALDINDPNGGLAINLRFRELQDLEGQYWRLEMQSDGSVKISNNLTGPDTYLDIQDESLRPMLAARDSLDQMWTLSSLGSTPTSTSASSTSSLSFTASSSHKSTATPTSSGSCAATECSEEVSSSTNFGTGAIAGTVVGVVVLLAGIGAIFFWRRWGNPTSRPSSPELSPPTPPESMSITRRNPVINA